jgi:hypothetical protein
LRTNFKPNGALFISLVLGGQILPKGIDFYQQSWGFDIPLSFKIKGGRDSGEELKFEECFKEKFGPEPCPEKNP